MQECGKEGRFGLHSLCLPPQGAPSWTIDRSVDLTQQEASARHTALDDSKCMRDEESSDSYSESCSGAD